MTQADSVLSTPPTNAPAILTKVASEVADLEERLRLAHNLAYAARMLATSDEMDRESGAALNSLAGVLVDLLDELITERDRIWHLAIGKEGGTDAETGETV